MSSAGPGGVRRRTRRSRARQVLATCRATTLRIRSRRPTTSATASRRRPRSTSSLSPRGVSVAARNRHSAMTGATASPFDAVLQRHDAHHRATCATSLGRRPLRAAPAGAGAGAGAPVRPLRAGVQRRCSRRSSAPTYERRAARAAGYVSPDGDYWAHAGTTAYDAASFYQPTATPIRSATPRAWSTTRCGSPSSRSTLPGPGVRNVTTATIDYRVPRASMVTDPNGNRSAAVFDEHRQGCRDRVMGKPSAGEGIRSPIPRRASRFDLLACRNGQGPAYVHTFAPRSTAL